MSISNISDLSKFTWSQTLFSKADKAIARLNTELTTGRIQDIGRDRINQTSEITQINQRLSLIDALEVVQSDADIFFQRVEHALDGIQTKTTYLAEQFLAASVTTTPTSHNAVAGVAKDTFDDIITHLNTYAAQQPVFGGAASTTRPIPDAEGLWDQLTQVAANATSIQELDAQLSDWFAASFDQFVEVDTSHQTQFELSNGSVVRNSLSAEDATFKDVLKSAALIFLSQERGFDPADIRQALATEAESLWSAQSQLVDLRAKNGLNQASVERSKLELDGEKSALTLRYNSLTASDPYETASELQATQSQLERLFVLTARMEKLSFLEYMK